MILRETSQAQCQCVLNLNDIHGLTQRAGGKGGPCSIPGQETRSYMPQLRVHMSKLKIPYAITKTWHRQINQFKKNEILCVKMPGMH